MLFRSNLEGMEDDRGQSRALLDEMGSPLRFLWMNGNVLSCYGYDEFGRDLYGNIGEEQPFGYTGYTFEELGGMYYAQAREYVPEHGRFSGEDILKGDAKTPVTLNEYIYCRNSALNYLDFLGTTEETSNDGAVSWLVYGNEADTLLKQHLKTHAETNKLTIKTSVYIPQGLDGDNPYYQTPSGHGFADIIYVNNGVAEVYELKHESRRSRVKGSLQLNGYIWAINKNIKEPYWKENEVTKHAETGSGLDDVINNFKATSGIHGGKTIIYYTDPLFPGMVFWSYTDDRKKEKFLKAREKDAKKVKDKFEEIEKKLKEQEEKEKPKVTAISTALEITGLVVALAFVVGNDLFAFPFDNVAIPVILGMLVAKFDELFGSCDTVA